MLNFLHLISVFRDIMRGEHWVILGLLSHWILMKIGIALESAGRIKEFSPKAWKNLRERRYKRVISVIRAAMSSIRTRRYPKNWIEVDTWNLCFFELVHDSFT
ncbi:hypothetical protein H5T89_06625 [bacterium]|nr:hypothetical protein [bacterium]